jgi:Polyketide cyclase / dehydrase and lipid transport
MIAEHVLTTTASARAVWAVYSDTAAWPEWDDALIWARLDGPFAAGSRGALKPRGGPTVKFVMTRADPATGFADETRLPFTRITFDHLIEPQGDTLRLTHRATANGPLGWLFGRLMGAGIRRSLPPAMERLVAMAAAREQ